MEKPQKPSSNNILKYAGLGFQMFAMIGIATWLGITLDKKLGMTKFPAFTLSLVLVAVIGSFISLIRSVKKDD